MGKLIATTQATLDGVVDPVGDWVQADGDHGDYSFERQARSSGLVLGRKTYEGLAGYWPSQSGKWADLPPGVLTAPGAAVVRGGRLADARRPRPTSAAEVRVAVLGAVPG